MVKTWRLLHYSLVDSKANLAVNEAIFRSRRTGLTFDTLRLWRSPNCLVLGTSGSYKSDVNHEACRSHDIEIVRASSVSGEAMYQGVGSLNFAVAADATCLKQLTENYQPILSEYQILNEGLARGLQICGVEAKADSSGVYVNNKIVSQALPLWFHDFLLFQGTLHINTELNVYNEIIGTKWHPIKNDMLTSLSHESCNIQKDEVEEALPHGIEQTLGIRFQEQSLAEGEQKLVDKLCRLKYSLHKWTGQARQPFLIGMGKTTIEVFVAYPPTSMCRKLIELVGDVVSDLQDEVEVMIWMRGRGLHQHGHHPEMSSALLSANKQSIIPVIIVNGELRFRESVPSKEDLGRAIVDAL